MKIRLKKDRGIAPKRRFSLSPTAIFIALALSAPTVVHSGALDEMLEGVYTNTTDAGAFKSQKMGHFQGGSFYARFPTKSINVAMFDPPRINAGCGGIDLFGGSFSFISGDEIVQILRSIGQNALGLLFHMGIQAISQPLATLLGHWADKLQQMNQALRNTCAAANKLVSVVTDGPAQAWDQTKAAMSKTFDGFWSDSAEAFKAGQAQARENSLWGKVATWAKRDNRQTVNNDDTKHQNNVSNDSKAGNHTWKALTNSKAHKRVGEVLNNTNKAYEREIKELIINIGGTLINDQSTPDSADENKKCAVQGADSHPCDSNPVKDYTTRQLSPRDLIENADKKDIMRCVDKDGFKHSTDHADHDMACLSMEMKPLSDVFKGSAYYVNRAMFGSSSLTRMSTQEVDQAIDNGRGLIGKGLGANTTMPTTEEIAILENTSIPFLAHLFYLQVDPQAQRQAIHLIYELMVEKYAYIVGQSLLNAARSAYIGGAAKVHAEKPQNIYDANLNAFAAELADMAVKPEVEIEKNMQLQAIRAIVEKNAMTKAVNNRISSNNNAK